MRCPYCTRVDCGGPSDHAGRFYGAALVVGPILLAERVWRAVRKALRGGAR